MVIKIDATGLRLTCLSISKIWIPFLRKKVIIITVENFQIRQFWDDDLKNITKSYLFFIEVFSGMKSKFLRMSIFKQNICTGGILFEEWISTDSNQVNKYNWENFKSSSQKYPHFQTSICNERHFVVLVWFIFSFFGDVIWFEKMFQKYLNFLRHHILFGNRKYRLYIDRYVYN